MRYAFAFEVFDQPTQLAQPHPFYVRSVMLDFREGLFFDGRYDKVQPLRPRSIQNQEWESAVTGYKAIAGARGRGSGVSEGIINLSPIHDNLSNRCFCAFQAPETLKAD
jgi:hypothetical protein